MIIIQEIILSLGVAISAYVTADLLWWVLERVWQAARPGAIPARTNPLAKSTLRMFTKEHIRRLCLESLWPRSGGAFSVCRA
jgi:hypothetical protein